MFLRNFWLRRPRRCLRKNNASAAVGCQLLRQLARPDRRTILQWVLSHCGIARNERLKSIAKDAATLDQDDVVMYVWTVHRAAARTARPCPYPAQASPAGL